MTWIHLHPKLTIALTVLSLFALTWGYKLIILRHSVNTYAEYWSIPRGEKGGLLYVAIGDSAAQSIGASEPQKGYVGLITDSLRKSTGKPVEIINLSKSGARISDVLDRQVPALRGLGRTPDVVTVAIGGNDIRAYDRQQFADEVQRLTSALPRGSYLADAPYFMHGHWEYDANQASRLLQAGAKEHYLHTVYLHEALNAQGWKAMVTQFAADWFHPNNNGHKVWADTFLKQIAVRSQPKQ